MFTHLVIFIYVYMLTLAVLILSLFYECPENL